MLFYFRENIATAHLYTQHEIDGAFDEYIDDIYAEEEAHISGVTFYPSRILKTDDFAWSQALDEYLNEFHNVEVPWEVYADGINDATSEERVRAWIEAHPQRVMDGR